MDLQPVADELFPIAVLMDELKVVPPNLQNSASLMLIFEA